MLRLAAATVLLLAFGVGCGGGHATPSECHGLSLGECRVTDGCVPDRCDGCGCDLTYRGCLATSETPAMCPALGCPSGVCCSSELACASTAGSCAPPGAAQGCGACNTAPSDCANDADCKPQGATMVCDPIACSCEGHLACVPGCTDDTTCADGTKCDVASARCLAIACADDGGCPGNFHCLEHACARLACTEDLACDGYCVEGSCYAQRGECRQPVP